MITNNPLQQYFRRPAVYLKLPSGGVDYGDSVLIPTETSELPVYPMTAIDEITIKTPDALFNGVAVVDLIKSCVPNIVDPWKLHSTDIDAVLLAIKAASGTQNLEVESKCPKCSEAATYEIDVMNILTSINVPNYDDLLEYGELKVKFKPLTYADVNAAGLEQFQITKLQQSITMIENDDERTKKTNEAVVHITNIAMNFLMKTIEYIESPNDMVTDPELILDTLKRCEKQLYTKIRDHHNTIKAETELEPLNVVCMHCEHKYQQPITINASDFFG